MAVAVLGMLRPFVVKFTVARVNEGMSSVLGNIRNTNVGCSCLSGILLVCFIQTLLCRNAGLCSRLFVASIIRSTVRSLHGSLDGGLGHLPVTCFSHGRFKSVLDGIAGSISSVTGTLRRSLLRILGTILKVAFTLVVVFAVD